MAAAAQAMRRILVDHARRHNAKRGANADHVSLDAEAVFCADRSDDFGALDEALNALAARAPRKAKVVELRFFGGLSVEETADVLRALAYERAANGLNFSRSYLGGLHSAYVRGQALIAAKKYPEAEIEFRKILENRGLVGLDPIGSLTRLQLARTLVLVGEAAKAKSAYNDLLTLWKDADPDVPVIEEARAEYARLP